MNYRHPVFAPYRELLAMLPENRVPTAIELSTLADAFHLHFRFAASVTPLAAIDYEHGIQATGIIPTRNENVHDFMNALVWLTFPAFKTALNHAHCRALVDNPLEARQRSPARDALTVLDESGVLVFTEEREFKRLLINRRWQELFVGKRQALAENTRFIVVGHSILEKLLAPYPSITGKCLFIDGLPEETTRADQLASDAIACLTKPKQLPPLPVAGIPGWHPENHLPHFYDDRSVFRPFAH
ncbi:MAG: DUF3025 domain-containing protein [Thiobacillaceae bacterium]